jgi:outer membrane protein assembly factor BamB
VVAELDLPLDDCPFRCQGGLTWDGDSLWVANGNTIYQLDPLSGQELATFEVDLDSIVGIAWDGQALLMLDQKGNLVWYDRVGQRLRRHAVASPTGWATGMAWLEGELWVVDAHGRLTCFDSEFERIGSFDLDQCRATASPYLAFYWDGESLWLADFEENRLSQCAPSE